MATKRAAKKSSKKGAKKSSKKAAAPGIGPGTLACLKKCHDQFIKCLITTLNFKTCVTQYQKCVKACLKL